MSICPSCGQSFSCGMLTGQHPCWCVKVPIQTIDTTHSSCFCPNCLEKPRKYSDYREVTWRLWLSYDGSSYCGFQFQPGLSSIQGKVQEALKALLGCDIEVRVGGRTDSGVHARGQTASCRFASRFDGRKLVLALASKLPPDIRVWRADEMPEDFDARNHAIGKRYVYSIDTALVEDPVWYRSRWHLPRKLSVEAMNQAAQHLIGEHDFESFRSVHCVAAHARRYLWKVAVVRQNNLLSVDIRGNAFCHNMVRIIVGTLVQVGLGRLQPDDMQKILAAKDRTKAGQTAPALGLSLDEIYYPDALEHGDIPKDVVFPRFPVSKNTWPFEKTSIKVGPWLS